jgi:uncharacterized protein YkwD
MRLLLCLCLVGFAAASRAGQKSPAKLELSAEEKELLKLTNAERKKHDLPALKPNPLLVSIARAHSANMAKQGKMDHNLDDKSPFHRIKAAGYKYQFAGENLAHGTIPIADIVKGWMESKPHRGNILREQYTEIGVGIVKDGKGVAWYTQVFAKPR